MHLTKRQYAALRDAIHTRLGYLYRVRERMGCVGFTADDKLYQRVRRADGALHALWVELHYRS